MLKRQAVQSIEAQKHQMIASLYANSAFDESEEGLKARTQRIEGFEEHFNKAVELVYHPELHKTEEIDWTNPFWAAAKRAYDRQLEQVRGEPGTVNDVVGDQLDPKQIEARERGRREIDQL